MKRAPRLSIITLTRNRAEMLSQNLASLVGQTTSGDEVIVIDNGSTDHTSRVLRVYREQLPLRVYRIPRGKYPHLYNAGIAQARRDVIVFLDDDCIASPTYLSRVRAAHRGNRAIAVQGMTYSIPKSNVYAEIMGDHYRHFLATNKLASGDLRILDNKNASIRKNLIRSVGGFCEQVDCGSEDIELGIRLRSKNIRIVLDPTIVAFHHERTTLGGFVAQHLRFARCEGYLDREVLPPAERIGLVKFHKLLLQLRSAWQRELSYFRQERIKDALLLPILYVILAVTRIYGYLKHA